MNRYQRIVAGGWRWLLLGFVGLAAFAAWRGPHLAVEASTELLLDEHDGDLAYYNLSRAEWQTDEYLVVCCHRAAGWFDAEALTLLNDFVQDVRKVEYAKSLIAITTVPLLRNQPTRGLPEPILLEGKDRKLNPKVDLAKAREELVAHTQARGNLISPDAKDTIVLVYLDVGAESVALEKLRTRLKAQAPDDPAARAELATVEPKYQAAATEVRRRRGVFVEAMRTLQEAWGPRFGEPVRISGVPFINVVLMEHIRSDLTRFGALALAVFTCALLAIYRRVRWVALPIATCVLPVGLLCALMVTVGRPITVVTANMPVLLFVLILPYTVYFIERWQERRAAHPDEAGALSATRAPLEIWAPCAFSCLTTMAGTAAHMPSGINPVRTFGWVMTAMTGVGLATVMLLLPAAVVPLRPLAVSRPAAALFAAPLRACVALVLRAPLLVVCASLAILGVSIWGTTKVTAETKFIDYFWPTSPIYEGLEYIDTRMSGTTPLEVILTSEQKGFFRTPDGLAALEAVAGFFDTVPETGNVRSFRTLVAEAQKALPKAKPEFLAGIVTALAKDQVAEFCTPDFTVARVLVRMKETAPTLHRDRILRALRAHLASLHDTALRGLTVRPTGVFVLYSNMLNAILKATRETFILVVICIWLMLAVLFRSPVLGTLVLLPQVLPVLLVLGVMGFTGIALDMVTVVIASVAMGIGIDAAIQYAVRYRRELDACGDVAEAVRRSHASIGRAILISTSIMFAGFAILMLSNFRPTFWFGMFTGLAIGMGLFASLTTLPAMFVLLGYPRPRPRPDHGFRPETAVSGPN